MSKFSQAEKIVTIHDLRYKVLNRDMKEREKLRLHLQMKNNIKFSNKIICVSNQTRSDLLNHYDVDEEKVKVIYHGADHFKEIKKGDINTFPDGLLSKYKIPKILCLL